MDWKTKKVDQFVIQNRILGQGQFGTVYLGHFRDNLQHQVAIKTIPMHLVQNSEQLQEHIKREITILTKINHPNVVKLHYVTKTQSNLYMFLEYCKDGDLAHYLETKQDKRLSELEAVIFFKHVISGFRALYEEKVIHRDIKPSNILLHNGLAKIADFGFARVFEPETMQCLSRVGSPIYMAPQVLEGSPFSSKCDIWSLGVMFYELLYGITPWVALGPCELLQKIKTQALKFPGVPVRSQKVKTLLQSMLMVKEEERVDWPELFSHEIIQLDEGEIRRNVERIGSQEDRLLRSISLNKLYIQDNLIMGYLIVGNGIEVEQARQEREQEQMQEQMQYEPCLENKVPIINKINSNCKHQRNLAFFYNFVIQNLLPHFQKHSSQCFPFSPELFFQLIFCISKNQLIKMHELYQEVTKDTSADYALYRNSTEYRQFLKQFQTDMDQANKFFMEIMKKCLALQSQAKQIILSEQSKEAYQQYLNIVDNNLSYTQEFKGVYQNTIKLALSKLSADTAEIQKMRYLLHICLEPQKQFTNNSYDFSKFYEEIQYLDSFKVKELIQKFQQ